MKDLIYGSARNTAATADLHISAWMGWTWPLMFILALLASSKAADAADKQHKAQLQVSAIILTTIKVKVLSQPSQIEIAPEHLAQGFIDINNASVLLITTNSPDGFMMSLTHDPESFSSVSASLSQGGATAEGENMISVRTQQVKDEPMRVSYRLHLHPQARAGNVPWPVALSFTPRAV